MALRAERTGQEPPAGAHGLCRLPLALRRLARRGAHERLAHLLNTDQFETLTATLKLSTKDSGALSVGGARGKVIYDEGVSDSELQLLPLTERWMGIELRGSQLEE